MSEHAFGKGFIGASDPDDEFDLFEVGTVEPREGFDRGGVGQVELDYLESGPFHRDDILQDMWVVNFGDVNLLMGHFVDTGEEKLPPPVQVERVNDQAFRGELVDNSVVEKSHAFAVDCGD